MREHMICTCGLLGPVVGQYNIIDSCLDSQKGLGKAQGRFAWPQLINIQRFSEIALFRFARPKGGGLSVSPIV